MGVDIGELSRALRRRFPSLSEEDAAQYAAEARLAAPTAGADEQLAAALRRVKADGYDDPVCVAGDLDHDADGEAPRGRWIDGLSDLGDGQARIEARVGLARPLRRRGSTCRLRPAVIRAAIALSRAASPEEQVVLNGRILRPLLVDGRTTPFRKLCRPGLCLGSTVKVERRLWRRLRDLAAALSAQLPPEQGRLW